MFSVSIVSRPTCCIASRELIARFRTAFSICAGSTSHFHSPGLCTIRVVKSSPRVRLKRVPMPSSSLFKSTAIGLSGCFLENASNLWVRSRARPAASSARLVRSRGVGPFTGPISSIPIRASSRLPLITVSRLLKSCAIPPVSWPTASILWACRSCALRRSRSVTSRAWITAIGFPSAPYVRRPQPPASSNHRPCAGAERCWSARHQGSGTPPARPRPSLARPRGCSSSNIDRPTRSSGE